MSDCLSRVPKAFHNKFPQADFAREVFPTLNMLMDLVKFA